VYLAEMHFLQVVPGSLLLSKHPEKPMPEENDGRFVAVGTPVYHAADQRRTGGDTGFRQWRWFGQFNGLPGSGTEGETSVRAWAWARAGPDGTPGTAKQTVGGGPSARREHPVVRGVHS
jgi:hypothetical protein